MQKNRCFFNILTRIHLTTTYQVICGNVLVVYDDSHIQNACGETGIPSGDTVDSSTNTMNSSTTTVSINGPMTTKDDDEDNDAEERGRETGGGHLAFFCTVNLDI